MLDTVSDKLVGLISRRAKANAKTIVESIQEEAAKWRPKGHKALSEKRRDYYEGRQADHLRQLLTKLYPVGGRDMHPRTLNYVRLICEQDSDVYRETPLRQLSGPTGEPLPDADRRIPLFAQMTRDVRLNRRLKEAERRLYAARTIFLHPMPSVLHGHPVLHLYWPHHVDIVPHPGNPADARFALAISARVSGREGLDHDVREVWTRPDPSEPWEVSRIDAEGNETFLLEGGTDEARRTWDPEVMGDPWISWHAGDPEGCPYLDDDHDLLDAQDAINVNLTEIGHMVRYQAHSALWTDDPNDAPIALGVGQIGKVGPQSTINVLDMNPKLAEVLDVMRSTTKMLAVTRRQSPGAYSEEFSAPESGYARRLSMLPQEEKRAEAIELAREMEEDALLPSLARIADAFGFYPAQFGDVGFRWTPAELDSLDDPADLQLRLIQAQSEGWITRERAAVLAGYYETEEQAAEAMAPRNVPTGPAPSLGERVLARVQEAAQTAQDDGGDEAA